MRPAVDRWLPRVPEGVAILVAAIAVAWATTTLLRRLDGLASGAYDLGFFQQVIWNVGATGGWTSSFHEGSFLGLHFSPALVLVALIQHVVGSDAHVLSLFHAVAIGGLVLASFLFLRAALRPSRWAGATAALLAALVPTWPTTQWIVRADFHPELAGIVLALLAGWAGLRGRPWAMWALAVGALLTREDVAYALVVVGLTVAARGTPRTRVHGRALTVVASAAGLVIVAAIMPWLRDGAASDTAPYYRWLGTGADVLTAPFRMPDRVLGAILRPEPWLVLLGMLVGLGGLPLLRPGWLVLVVPPFAALVLSAHAPQATIIQHYPIVLIVPLLVAAAMGGRRALALATRRRRTASSFGRLALLLVPAGMVVAGALAVAWLAGPLPPFADRIPMSLARDSAIRDLRTIASIIPDGAPVVADEGLLAPLAARPEIRQLTATGLPPGDAYIVIDRDPWHASAAAEMRRERVLSWIAMSGRRVVADDGRFIVLAPLVEGSH